jgi:hypothetical protein
MLRTRSKASFFIIGTHRKKTMQQGEIQAANAKPGIFSTLELYHPLFG